MPSIYLAGPMSGLTYQECLIWREYVSDSLMLDDIKTLSPLRWRSWREKLVEATGEVPEIVRRDWFDVSQCDIVFAYFGKCSENMSVGTVSELSWAYALRKPTIMVAPKDSIYRHVWLTEMVDYVRSDLDQGIDVVRKLLG